MSDDDKVKRLGVKFKAPPKEDGPMLRIVHSGGRGDCDHRWTFVDGRMRSVQYLIREGETEVECGNCGTRLDPMFVLKRLAHEETKWLEARATYAEEMKRLGERSRTKCQHCGQMTRISRS